MSTLINNVPEREQLRSYLMNMAPHNLSPYQLEDWLSEQMVIEDYRRQALKKMIAALPKVVELAQTKCSAGHIAATLLLNLYNRHEWHFDLVGMRNLDFDNWRACMDVLSYQTLSSPNKDVHHYIPGGSRVLQELWSRYESTSNYIGRK